MVTIETLNVGQGDKPIYIEDTTPKERDHLAAEVLSLRKKGFALFLIQGSDCRQIVDYDRELHQWVLLSDAKPAPRVEKQKESAKDTTVKAVGQTAGG